MKALRFEQTRSPDALKLVETDPPLCGPGEVLVRVGAAAVNPSDVKNVLGEMSHAVLPRVTGPAELLGREVSGSSGDLGLEESAVILRALLSGIESGWIPPPALETCPPEGAVAAYCRLHAGEAAKKIILLS